MNPQSREAIPAIPSNLAVTAGGDRFLLHDSGFGDENRMIVFASDQALDLLKQTDHWLGDGTFSVTPSIFFQVCTPSFRALNRFLLKIRKFRKKSKKASSLPLIQYLLYQILCCLCFILTENSKLNVFFFFRFTPYMPYAMERLYPVYMPYCRTKRKSHTNGF